jgi:outer membrane biosynthesis protein TonB
MHGLNSNDIRSIVMCVSALLSALLFLESRPHISPKQRAAQLFAVAAALLGLSLHPWLSCDSVEKGLRDSSVSDNSASDDPTPEPPTPEPPTPEEPTQEEPTQEEPTQEEPTQEEPTQEEPTQEEPTQEEPTQEEPTQEEPTQEEPTQEEAMTDAPTRGKSRAAHPAPVPSRPLGSSRTKERAGSRSDFVELRPPETDFEFERYRASPTE